MKRHATLLMFMAMMLLLMAASRWPHPAAWSVHAYAFLPALVAVAVFAALLFALDFPLLTLAFAAVAQVSPIIAAGSAVALSLFLVLGAHALGGPLRELASYLPAWCRSLVTAAVIMALLVAIIAVTIPTSVVATFSSCSPTVRRTTTPSWS